MSEDTNENRVTLSEAARIAGVHFNTVRNWRKAGRLKTAEKVLANGIEIWTVALSEVQEIVTQSAQHNAVNTAQRFVDNNQHYQEGPQANSNTTAISASAESTLALIREVTKPLTEVIDRQQETIEKQQLRLEGMATELGELRATVNQLKLAQNTSQDSPQSVLATQGTQTPTQPDNGPQSGSNELPAPTSNKQRRRGSWWERLVGGG